jgi:beta-galactosidase
MFNVFATRSAWVLVFPLCIAFSVQAQTAPLKRKALFNLNWKFTSTNPANAQAVAFNDSTSSWSTVSIPHSGSYDAPYQAYERNHLQGTFWYRKHFTCPAAAQKVFMHFEGVMQTCDLFVNGDSIGTHQACGYTPFFFDISNALKRGQSNVVALRVNASYSYNVPPGGPGASGPDFFLFSGLYRNVWLLFKDSVYIPDWGQRITTPGTTSSAAVRAVTAVTNASAAAQGATVSLTLFNAAGISVATQSGTQSIPAGATDTFTLTTNILSPQLWSPETPNLYSLRTLVSVNGVVKDSIVQPVGFRWFSWSTSTGFSLNGTRYELRGFCLHQYMGWVENALPESRFYLQIKMMKAMGINSIRCSHYPRAQAFYDACDKLGMLLYVELPTWMGAMSSAPPAAFWSNLDTCASEMVRDGFNHPSIFAWGIANEPNYTYTTPFTAIVGIIHSIDPVSGSGRVTSYAHMLMAPSFLGTDVIGTNYEIANKTYASGGLPTFNSEWYGNGGEAVQPGCWGTGSFGRVYARGSAMDLDVGPGSEAANELCNMTFTDSTSGFLGGGFFWCFLDYQSFVTSVGLQGVVDRFCIPKGAYYMFRNAWTGAAPDYPKTTGSATKIDLVSDTSSLLANGSDFAVLTANLRNAGDTCIAKTCNITWNVTGPATLFPTTGYSGNLTSVTDSALGGRAGVLLRTTNTPGTIYVTATSSCGIPTANITLTSKQVTESYNDTGAVSAVPGLYSRKPGDILRPKIAITAKGMMISFPSKEKTVWIMNCRGEKVASYTLRNGTPQLVDRVMTGNGVFWVVWNDNGRQAALRLSMVR